MTIRIVLTGFGDVGKNKFTPALLSLIDESHRKNFRFIAFIIHEIPLSRG